MEEVLIYGGINEWSSEYFINRAQEYISDPLRIRVNSDGGEPESCYGIISKLKERTKETLIHVDAKAHSMAAFFLCYVDTVECLNVSTFIIHRAAFSSNYERDGLSDQHAKDLKEINADLRQAFESRS